MTSRATVERIPIAIASRRGGTTIYEYMREEILTGERVPGTVLSQVQLARSFGVSATPVREALRMLQQDGLVECEPNRRARITGFDPDEFDSLYAGRILLESLGASMTLERLSDSDVPVMQQALSEMERLARLQDHRGWHDAHRRLHALLVAGAPEPLARSIATYADRGGRFVRIYQQLHPTMWRTVTGMEHRSIVDAMEQRDREGVVVLIARHLAQAAADTMAALASGREPVAVNAARDLVIASARDANPAVAQRLSLPGHK
jgi:DNA-binding GntR family transcriptional regulator